MISDFDNAFHPQDYLEYFFDRPVSKNAGMLYFFAEVYKHCRPTDRMLEFGGGPTVYQLISPAAYVGEIHYSDYLQSNLDYVLRWMQNDLQAWNWDEYIRKTLQIETPQCVPTSQDIQQRKELIQTKVTRFLHCNALDPNPLLDPRFQNYYDVIGMSYCIEGIVSEKLKWKEAFANVTSLLKPGGTLVMNAIGESFNGWLCKNQRFVGVYLTQVDIYKCMKQLGYTSIYIKTTPSNDPSRGYRKYHRVTGILRQN